MAPHAHNGAQPARRPGGKRHSRDLHGYDFKDINDTLGHEAGDRLLVEVGERLLGCLRHEDTFARFGGDEFVVMLESAASLDDVRAAAERIMQSLRAPFSIADREIFITTSIGIAQSSPSRESSEELLRGADVALYQAKKGGRAGYKVFDATMNLRAGERLNLIAELHRAIESEQFVLRYQPKLDLTTREVVGVEALLRWEHPARGTIHPADFVPVAEETGLIRPIGGWALGEACRQLKEWQDRGLCEGSLTVSVNLSSCQFHRLDLTEKVVTVLEETGLEPRCLALELTESVLMRDVDHTASTLRSVKELGMGISIDDFGTGYSNLSYLTRFPVGELKIDKSFVERLEEQSEDEAVVQTVIDLARALSMEVIAEGIETGGQTSKLRELGCERGQGNHFARPLEAPDLGCFLWPGHPR